MLNKYFVTALFGLLLSTLTVVAQDRRADVQIVKSSAAYAEVLLRRTEVQAEIESLLQSYTETHPKVVDLRAELTPLERDIERLMAVRSSETGKLTSALGKLIVRRASLQSEFDRLARSYSKDHPEVKRAQRRVEFFDAAIAEVLK
jgi:uncharacterized protein involved in exopolysaccharide biosynthesis